MGKQFEKTNRSLYDAFWMKNMFGAKPRRIRRSEFSRTLDILNNTPQFDRNLLQRARSLARQIDEVNEISQDIAERVAAEEGNVQNLLAALNILGNVRGATIASDVLAKYFP